MSRAPDSTQLPQPVPAMPSPVDEQEVVPRASATAEPFDYESIPVGYYDEVFRRRKGIQSKWHHLKFERVAGELEGHRRVLDVGCGPGTMIGLLSKTHDCVGTDLSVRQIDYASRAYGSETSRFYASAPAGLPDGEGPFDAVTLVELIEHLDPALVDETIREALERLRPGGKLVLTTPNFRSAWPLIEAMINRLSDVTYDFQHINKFDPARLSRLLQSYGLVQTRVEPYLFMAPFGAAVNWQLADRVARFERGTIDRRLGMLLLGTGVKPA
jgi:2-polyprenyl-3-methyl-5-hydroxy-6-metoxy-1,4-benzoquinol methylase